MSSSGNLALQYPPTPPTSLTSGNHDDEVFIPKIGNPTQHVLYTLKRHPHPIHIFQQLTPIPDKPESLTHKNHGQTDLFRPYDLRDNPTTSAQRLHPLPSVSTVIERLQDMTLQTHIETNAHVTGCLICGKP